MGTDNEMPAHMGRSSGPMETEGMMKSEKKE
jgi:hypothetical protein